MCKTVPQEACGTVILRYEEPYRTAASGSVPITTVHPNLKPNYVGYVEVLLLGIKFPIFKIPFLFIKTIVLTTLLESMHHNNSNSINTQIVASHSTANEIRIFLFYISTEWDATIWILIELQ